MPEYNDLMQAARRADAEGDALGAKRLLELAAKSLPESDMSSLRAAAIGVRQGLTLGAGDEIMAAARAVPALFDGERDFGDAYDSALGDERATLDTARRDHKIASIVGEAGGAVLPMLIPGVNAIAAGKGAVSAGRLMATGALEGGVYAFNEGEGGVGNRSRDAAIGTGVGAGLGLAAKPAARLVGGVIDAGRNIANKAAGEPAEALARKRIAQLVGRAKGDVPGQMAAAGRAGQGDVFALADAIGDPAQRELRGIAVHGGEPRDMIVDQLTRRQQDQSGRVGQFVEEAFTPDGKTARQTEKALRDSRSAMARAEYGAARREASPVILDGVLERIDASVGDLIRNGEKGVNEPEEFLMRTWRTLKARNPGALGGEDAWRSDFNGLQRLRSELDARARKTDGALGVEMKGIVRALDDALAEASDPYREALVNYRLASDAIDAVESGRKAFTGGARAADVADEFKALPTDTAKGAYSSGYGDAQARIIERKDFTNDAARGLRNRTAENIAETVAGPTRAEALRQRLIREKAMTDTQNRTLSGSLTADNLAAAGDVAMRFREQARGPVEAAWNLARYTINAATSANEPTRRRIAELLLQTGDPGAPQIAQALAQGKQLTASQKRIAAALLNAALGGGTSAGAF